MNIIEEQKNEVWRDIPNFGMYQVSNLGRVKRKTYEKFYFANKNLVFRPEKILKQQKDINGYLVVTLNGEIARKTLRVHRLVALAFVPNPNNDELVNHLNENKQDNRVENVMWASAKVNANWGTRNERISTKNNKKIFSKKHRKNLAKSAMGNKNRTGKKNSLEHKKRVVESKSKSVICDNIKYSSIKECANAYEVNHFTMCHWLNGSRKMPEKFLQLGLKLVEVE